ncbi:undecaprenyl-phosphate glucose phosphotransferase [Methylomonas rivi]|uniref:Undecaprenyl-phosphate glucose phosphotransferase n=1 Tax=Methylomonas rivi TaxID=2952226 RepID=A0ABT1UBS4_9GAMM|nr:undecaprenyl-phosphate glucose phosphotransferase [Methylomonas sp. WSC-6]MCQ8130536.1 undecaprenyl-phosphate glucose phosphotransferase [Methylomonas sp. WSC-6]
MPIKKPSRSARVSKGYIRPYASGVAVLQRLADAAVMLVTLYLSTLRGGMVFDANLLQIAVVGALGFYAAGEARGIYGSWRMNSVGSELWLVAVTCTAAFGLVLAVAFFNKATEESLRSTLFTWLLLAPLSLMGVRLCVRLLLRELRRRGRNTRTVAIAGVNLAAFELAGELNAMPWTGLVFKGFYDDCPAEGLISETPFQVLGSLARLVAEAHKGGIDVVYVALPIQAKESILDLLAKLADTTASVYLLPDFFVFEIEHAHWVNLNGIPVVSVHETPFTSIGGSLKRLEDVLLSAAILTVAALPMLVIALALKLSSPGPVIFRQKRYGLDGKPVHVWKFRSMTVCEEGDRVVQARPMDVRVTRFGRFLRRTSLDELPQFINVLQGTMSVVGPRPHAIVHNEQYRRLIHGYMLRHKVKPGITGWAQVNGWRGETDAVEKMQKRVDYDLHYIRNWSLWLDLKIVWMTVLGGFAGKNAY